ncbi:recombinase family protein [Streptomyces phytohabitans]|uniref:recombinase family protein n=1 Tax=Streptomyces phytohabitans TaxID=1150371 RepID=UPI00345BF750
MAKRAKRLPASERAAYHVETEWSEADLALLAELRAAEALLPADAPRALLSVRLSVFTDDTTSPVRQELDLRTLARERKCRVVGVASDLNVSATKVPPWKRKSLGDWLNNRTPEFDELLFWKLDRFIRNLGDLNVMMNWSLKYEKNLISKHDTIDLSTTAGKIMVTIIGGVAEIEAANTSTRVTSLWDYTKTQGEWLVGNPPYGYETADDEDDKVVLVIDAVAYKALHWARRMAIRGVPTSRMVTRIKRSKLMSGSLTTSTLLRRLRNPGLMGLRVEEDKESGGARRSKLVYGRDGKPIRIAEPIFTDDEFESLQAALDKRAKNQPPRQPTGATKFLGVLICVDCTTNMTVQVTTNKFGEYRYLRCQRCKSGGLGAPHPMQVYERLVADVLKVLGDEEVQVREYAKGAEARKEVKRLKESIAHYMKELEPGGRYAKVRFTREQAQETVDKLIAELQQIDPETTEDRWVSVRNGETFRQRWEAGGMEAMAADLVRVGVKCEVTRTKVPKVRAPRVHLKLKIPRDVRQRLVVRQDDFADQF